MTISIGFVTLIIKTRIFGNLYIISYLSNFHGYTFSTTNKGNQYNVLCAGGNDGGGQEDETAEKRLPRWHANRARGFPSTLDTLKPALPPFLSECMCNGTNGNADVCVSSFFKRKCLDRIDETLAKKKT